MPRRARKWLAEKPPSSVLISALGGEVDFDANVFAPRDPLINIVAENLPADISGQKWADVGSGSGAVAILLAQRGAIVTALDIKNDCIKVGVANARKFGVDGVINFTQSDLFTRIDPQKKFDGIVLTPSPYPGFDPSVRHLYDYPNHVQRFFEAVPNRLEDNGIILFRHSTYPGLSQHESGWLQVEQQTREFAKQQGFSLTERTYEDTVDVEHMLRRVDKCGIAASREKTTLFILTHSV